MKVELIGTGAIYVKYNSACTLINDNMIVDMPNGTLKQLLKTGHHPEKIQAMLITHLHGDHTADIPFFLKYMYRFSKVTDELTIIGPKGLEDKVTELFSVYKFEDKKEIEETMNIKFIELEQEDITINQYKIKPILVSHGEEKPAFGYIINDSLGLTGDSAICSGVEKIVENSKITIADTSYLEGDSCHMGVNNIKYLIEKYDKPIVATHLRDTTREELKRMNIPNIIVEEDGYGFEV